MSKGNNSRLRDLFVRCAEWDLQRDRIFFFFELGFTSALFVFAVIAITGSFPLPVQVSALGVLCFVGRAVISHLTGK